MNMNMNTAHDLSMRIEEEKTEPRQEFVFKISLDFVLKSMVYLVSSIKMHGAPNNKDDNAMKNRRLSVKECLIGHFHSVLSLLLDKVTNYPRVFEFFQEDYQTMYNQMKYVSDYIHNDKNKNNNNHNNNDNDFNDFRSSGGSMLLHVSLANFFKIHNLGLRDLELDDAAAAAAAASTCRFDLLASDPIAASNNGGDNIGGGGGGGDGDDDNDNDDNDNDNALINKVELENTLDELRKYDGLALSYRDNSFQKEPKTTSKRKLNENSQDRLEKEKEEEEGRPSGYKDAAVAVAAADDDDSGGGGGGGGVAMVLVGEDCCHRKTMSGQANSTTTTDTTDTHRENAMITSNANSNYSSNSGSSNSSSSSSSSGGGISSSSSGGGISSSSSSNSSREDEDRVSILKSEENPRFKKYKQSLEEIKNDAKSCADYSNSQKNEILRLCAGIVLNYTTPSSDRSDQGGGDAQQFKLD